MWNWDTKAYHTADNQQEGMHAGIGQDQPRGALEAEKKSEAQEQSQHKQMLENVPKSNKNTKNCQKRST